MVGGGGGVVCLLGGGFLGGGLLGGVLWWGGGGGGGVFFGGGGCLWVVGYGGWGGLPALVSVSTSKRRCSQGGSGQTRRNGLTLIGPGSRARAGPRTPEAGHRDSSTRQDHIPSKNPHRGRRADGGKTRCGPLTVMQTCQKNPYLENRGGGLPRPCQQWHGSEGIVGQGR